MTELNVIHILPRWNHGGGAQSIIVEAAHARQTQNSIRHQAIALEAGGSLPLVRAALMQRLRVHSAPSAEDEKALIASAQVVVLHYWNTPSVRHFLDRWRGRPLPLILYSRINGAYSPQRLPIRLAETAARTFLTSPHLQGEIPHDRVTVLPAIVKLGPEPPEQNESEPGSSILHAGTLNVFKLSPHFIPLHANIANSSSPIDVVGSGGDEERLQLEAEALQAREQFRWLGFVNDMPSLYAKAKVLSYPISPISYASSDKVVQESQLCGLPVLTLKDSPISHLVADQKTGVLANDLEHYRSLIEQIARDECPLPSRTTVRKAAQANHDPIAKCRTLEAAYREVAETLPSELDDGYPTIQDWMQFQIGDTRINPQHQRPSLPELRENPELLQRHQNFACEGGLAQYLNSDFTF